MKKGELRKEAIVRTAEKLFFEKGYDETSIQDILDALSISKGGFYHYFESKIALLEEISRQKCASNIERIRMELFSGKFSSIQKVNLLLSAIFPFGRESAEYNALTFKVSYIDGDVHFRNQTRQLMLDELCPLMNETVLEGISDDSFFVRYPGHIGRILLMLGYDACDEVCRMLAENADNPEIVIEMLDLLNAYREAVETLLGAPHGSISLFDVEQILSAIRQTAEQILILKGCV